MPFERDTLSTIVTRIETDIITRITGAVGLLRRSILKVLARALGGAVHTLYSYIEYNKDQMFASSADAENLEKQANEFGITRTAAVKATGTVLITGTAGTVIPIYTELQSSTDQVYLTDTADTIEAGGSVAIDVTAKVAGTDGNEDSGSTLTFVSPISGVDTSATISTAIDGGSDEETDADLRERTLTRKRQPPHGGALFDYVSWMLEVSGVTRAWAFASYQGVGTVGCAFARDDDDDIIPSESEVSTVESYIESHTDSITGKTVGKPTTASLYMITLTEKTMNFTIGISPNTTAVQTAITSQLTDLIEEEGGPGETIYLSKIQNAISTAVGEEYNTLVYPTTNQTAATNEIHVMGTITFQDYA